MANPKRKQSKRRSANRRAANAFIAPEFARDPTDGSAFNGESNYWVMRGGCFSSASYAQDDNYSRSLGFNSVCVGFRLAR